MRELWLLLPPLAWSWQLFMVLEMRGSVWRLVEL